MENEIYQSVVEELVKYLPEGWEKVDMNVIVSEHHCSAMFFVMVNGEYIYSMDLREKYGIDTIDLSRDLLYILRPDQQEKNYFAMNFYLKNTGEFNVEYDYEKPENTVTYKDDWYDKHMEANTKAKDE